MRFAVLVLACVLVGAAPALAQPRDEGLPAPARARRFEGLSVTLTDIRGKSSSIAVAPDGKVTVDGRKGTLTPAERAALQAAFEGYDDSYGLTDGRAAAEASVTLTQPAESWYVPPVSLALEVRTKTSRHRCAITVPQLDRLDAKRVEHALARALLDVRSRVLLEGLSATLTVAKPKLIRTTDSAEIARITSDGVLVVETRTTRKRQGKLQTNVYPTWQRLASAAEIEVLRLAVARSTGEAPNAFAVIRLADGTLRPADRAVSTILELERHGGPKPGEDSNGFAAVLEKAAAEPKPATAK